MWFLYDGEEDDSDYKEEDAGDSDVDEDGDEVLRDGCSNRERSALSYYCASVCS